MASTRNRRPSAENDVNQLRSAVAVQPCRSSTVGAPGGPATSRMNVVPRPGSSTFRPGGRSGVAGATFSSVGSVIGGCDQLRS